MRRVLLVVAATLGLLAIAAPAQAVAPMTVTVDAVGTANPNGSATVSGTVTCPATNTFYGYATVRQPGRVPNAAKATGLFGSPQTPIPCTGAPVPWTVTTGVATPPFVAGPAEVQAVFSTQGPAGLNTVQAFVPIALV